jgi:uncharacterized membrane protein
MNKKFNQSKRMNSLTGAAVLIIIIFMVFIRRTNLTWSDNWWALLFLIPAVASLNNFLSARDKLGEFSFTRVTHLAGILFPLVLTFLLLFGMPLTIVLPAIIILAGFSMWMMGFIRQQASPGKIIHSLRWWFFSWGFAVMLVGLIMALTNFQKFSSPERSFQFYGLTLIIAAMGGLISAWVEHKKTEKNNLIIAAHLLVAFIFLIPGILIFI